MEVERFIVNTIDVVYLHFIAHIRYWENIEIFKDGVKVDENKMPGRMGEFWDCTINVDEGKFLNWIPGVVADVYFKVCDEFSFEFIDNKGNYIFNRVNEYVPRFMCPEEPGYGDYIIMHIDENGFIRNWSTYYVKSYLEESLKSEVIS